MINTLPLLPPSRPKKKTIIYQQYRHTSVHRHQYMWCTAVRSERNTQGCLSARYQAPIWSTKVSCSALQRLKVNIRDCISQVLHGVRGGGVSVNCPLLSVSLDFSAAYTPRAESGKTEILIMICFLGALAPCHVFFFLVRIRSIFIFVSVLLIMFRLPFLSHSCSSRNSDPG